MARTLDEAEALIVQLGAKLQQVVEQAETQNAEYAALRTIVDRRAFRRRPDVMRLAIGVMRASTIARLG